MRPNDDYFQPTPLLERYPVRVHTAHCSNIVQAAMNFGGEREMGRETTIDYNCTLVYFCTHFIDRKQLNRIYLSSLTSKHIHTHSLPLTLASPWLRGMERH